MMKIGVSVSNRKSRALTTGPIAWTLFVFALPTLGSNILQSLNGSINAIWVGQFLGDTGLAAVSNANIVMFMMFVLVFGFGMACSIMIGQSMGRHDLDAARRGVGAGLGFFAMLGFISATIGWLGSPELLHFLGTPPDVYHRALIYLRIMFLGMPASLITVFLGMALRGMGDSLTPLIFIIPGALLDVGLNPVFILGLGPAPRLGIAGAATATLIANWASCLGLLVVIYARDLPVRLRGAELRYLWPPRAYVATIVAKGIPMGLQLVAASLSALAMLGLVNREGTATIAAYGAVNQLWAYIQMPALAMGAAMTSMAAQNIGADRWDRVERIALTGIVMNLLLTGTAVFALIVLDRFILALFLGSDGVAIAIARHINLLASWGFILMGVMVAQASIVRANGATMAPLVIMSISYLPGRLGMAYLLQPIIGADAIWWSFPLGSGLAMVLTAGYYRYGGWRKLKLIEPLMQEEAEEFAQTDAQPLTRIHPNI
jgi:putative MATE family efflux protein